MLRATKMIQKSVMANAEEKGQSQPLSYLIIGGGAFGAPTALALKRAKPEADVVLIDRAPFPCPYAAGHDLNKICRADYGDLMYAKLAVKALRAWTSDPIYRQHFHQTGMLYAYDEAYLKCIINNWETIYGEDQAPSYRLTAENARNCYNGIFSNADWSLAEGFLMSPTAGWADSAAALQCIIQTAIDLGVKYLDIGARKLLFDDEGVCVGIETLQGINVHANRTILAAGAYTPLILADSAPDRPEIHAGKRLTAVGAAMCAYTVPDELVEKFCGTPIMALMAKLPAECIPPGEKQLLKCTLDTGFSNKIRHERSRLEISVPPSKTSQSTWSDDIPQVLKQELRGVLTELYGEWTQSLKPKHYRMCWDGFTPNQDWILCAHPEVDNLFIVGGGSFHGFKFLPVIGELVVDMIDGRLNEEMQRRFAWDRSDDGLQSPQYMPARDLQDLWRQPEEERDGSGSRSGTDDLSCSAHSNDRARVAVST